MLRSRIVFGGGYGTCESADCRGSESAFNYGGQVAAVVCGVGTGRAARRAAVGPAADPRPRCLAKSTNPGLSATRSTRALECANAGAQGGLAAQHGPRHVERLGTASPARPDIYLQPGSGIRAETARHRGVVLEPALEVAGAVCGRKARGSSVRPHTTIAPAVCHETAELDQ